ncbi:unnamed protein product [Rotaria sp. Silwood2]|nr:unnamed protein product [Rotaria sp. Silwood2]
MIKDNLSNGSLTHDFHSIELCFGHNPVFFSASEIGFLCAFVRLTLERRLSSSHLSELFFHSDLLQSLYKREAFLPADDRGLRKQFLAHVESLQLLDYKCFSNSYADIYVIFYVIIFRIRARSTRISSITTANHQKLHLKLNLKFPCGRWLNNNNGLFDFGSSSQLMTTSLISGGSQTNRLASVPSRSPRFTTCQ